MLTCKIGIIIVPSYSVLTMWSISSESWCLVYIVVSQWLFTIFLAQAEVSGYDDNNDGVLLMLDCG